MGWSFSDERFRKSKRYRSNGQNLEQKKPPEGGLSWQRNTVHQIGLIAESLLQEQMTHRSNKPLPMWCTNALPTATEGYGRDIGWMATRASTIRRCIASCEMLRDCCLGRVKSRWTPENMKAKLPSSKATCVGVRMDWSCRVTTVNASGLRLRWTVATERS